MLVLFILAVIGSIIFLILYHFETIPILIGLLFIASMTLIYIGSNFLGNFFWWKSKKVGDIIIGLILDLSALPVWMQMSHLNTKYQGSKGVAIFALFCASFWYLFLIFVITPIVRKEKH